MADQKSRREARTDSSRTDPAARRADENVEVEAEEEAEGAKPSVGTDPMRTPGEAGHKQVAPDEEKVKQADRREHRRQTDEGEAERIKNA